MATQFNIIRRPKPWTTLKDYYIRGPAGKAQLSPLYVSTKHALASLVCDSLYETDKRIGVNRIQRKLR